MTELNNGRDVWLTLDAVHKFYGELHVLDSIDIEVHQEEIVTILGPSGCGKTTLLRILNGLIPHDDGEVLYKNQRVTGPRPEMAMVFQHFGLFPWKTHTYRGACFPSAGTGEQRPSCSTRCTICSRVRRIGTWTGFWRPHLRFQRPRRASTNRTASRGTFPGASELSSLRRQFQPGTR